MTMTLAQSTVLHPLQIRRSTRAGTLITTAAERLDIDAASVLLLVDGNRWLDHETAEDINLQENDVVDVMKVQYGD